MYVCSVRERENETFFNFKLQYQMTLQISLIVLIVKMFFLELLQHKSVVEIKAPEVRVG